MGTTKALTGAGAPVEAAVRPFIKWAGGKRFVAELLGHVGLLPPPKYRRYVEPFVGGGAVFFHLQPSGGLLNDANSELMNAYRVVKEEPALLVSALKRHEQRHQQASPAEREASYYRVRSQKPASLTPIEQAARFIFLNRTCYNGLYRVNRQGAFNVPIGRYSNPTICDEENLQTVSRVLKGIELTCRDFRELEDEVQKGDFVYCDPPYYPLSQTSNFTSYTPGQFSSKDHEDLAHLVKHWSDHGAFILVSNSATPFIRALYERQGFRPLEIPVARFINSKATLRGPVTELVVANYLPRHRS